MTRMTASLTADIVVLDPTTMSILVVKRRNQPFQFCWALPGGYVDEGETFLQAAVRELEEETGLVYPQWYFKRMGIYDLPDRDPRGRVVTQVFKVVWSGSGKQSPKAADDALELCWRPWREKGLAFDHDVIVSHVMNGY